jgi:hypothetical protein
MAAVDRTSGLDLTTVPDGLLEELVARPPAELRSGEVARARQHAEDRHFDDVVVVEEIASQLLLLSAH